MQIQPEAKLERSERVVILSDVHLGDGSPSDLFGRKDDLFVDVLRREADRADVVLVNGDAVDHLQGRTTARIERAHPRVFDALRDLSRRKPVLYVLGNHEDHGALEAAFPDFRYVGAVTVGDDLLVTHGHQFDLNWGAGEHPWMVDVHTFLETVFALPIRQPFRDYDNPLNRVVHRLFFFYTQALRYEGLLWKALGRPDKHAHWRRVDNFWARGQWGDLGCIFEAAAAWLLVHAPQRGVLVGHSHQPGVVTLGDRTYANAGSWALEHANVAIVEDGAPRVIEATTGREWRDERYRMLTSGAELPDMAGWFRRYYRGWFRYDVDAIRRDFPPISGG